MARLVCVSQAYNAGVYTHSLGAPAIWLQGDPPRLPNPAAVPELLGLVELFVIT